MPADDSCSRSDITYLPHRLEDFFAWFPKAALSLLHLVRGVVEGKASQTARAGNLWNCLSVADLVYFNEGSLSLGQGIDIIYGQGGVSVVVIFRTEERRLLCHFRSQANITVQSKIE